MRIRLRTVLLASVLLPLLPAGAASADACHAGTCGANPQTAPLVLAWRDGGGDGGGRQGGGGGQGNYSGPRPTCAAGTHFERGDCVKDASGPAIVDQPQEGCPRDYHTNRKGTKCVRNGYED